MAKPTRWSVDDIKNVLRELDKKTGADSSNIPVEINPRLKRALARYTCYTQSRKPVKFDLGTKILNVPDFKALEDTIIHEYAHFIVNTHRKSKDLGHSAEFRQVCKDLGTDNYNATCTRFVSQQLRLAENAAIEQEIEEFEEELPEVKQEEQPTVKEQPKQTKKGRLIAQYDLDGNFIKAEYRAYWKSLNYPMGNVSKCCNGKLKTCKGYIWRYLD